MLNSDYGIIPACFLKLMGQPGPYSLIAYLGTRPKLVAADVRRRTSGPVIATNPPSHVGGYRAVGFFRHALSLLLVSATCASASNPVLFVTQVPVPGEVNDNVITNVVIGVGAGFGNHLGATYSAPRGGGLLLGKPQPPFT